MSNEFNPNRLPYDPTAVEDPTAVNPTNIEDIIVEKENRVANSDNTGVDSPEEPEKALENTPRDYGSLEKLSSLALKDDDMKTLAIKYLLGEFDGLMEAVLSTKKEVNLMNTSLPELVSVIDNYVEKKKEEVSEDIQTLEDKVSTINSMLLSTSSETLIHNTDQLTKTGKDLVANFKESIDAESKRFEDSVSKTTLSLKSYLTKNSIFLLVFIFFFQLLIFGVFYILIKN